MNLFYEVMEDINAEFQYLFFANQATREYIRSYLHRSATQPIYFKHDVETRLNSVTLGASVVGLLINFDSGLDIDHWRGSADKRSPVYFYLVIRKGSCKVQDVPWGIWSAPI